MNRAKYTIISCAISVFAIFFSTTKNRVHAQGCPPASYDTPGVAAWQQGETVYYQFIPADKEIISSI